MKMPSDTVLTLDSALDGARRATSDPGIPDAKRSKPFEAYLVGLLEKARARAEGESSVPPPPAPPWSKHYTLRRSRYCAGSKDCPFDANAKTGLCDEHQHAREGTR